MAQDDIIRTSYAILTYNKPGYVIKVLDPLDDRTSEQAYYYPFNSGDGYYIRIAELEYGEGRLYRTLAQSASTKKLKKDSLGQSEPPDSTNKLDEAPLVQSGPLDYLKKLAKASKYSVYVVTEAAFLDNSVEVPPEYDYFNISKEQAATFNKSLKQIYDDYLANHVPPTNARTLSLGTNDKYKKFKKNVEKTVGVTEREVRKYILANFMPGNNAKADKSLSTWLEHNHIFSIYEMMLWSGIKRKRKYLIDMEWQRQQKDFFANVFAKNSITPPEKLYSPLYEASINDHYYFILNHTNLAGYCYLLKMICEDEAFFEFVKDYSRNHNLFSDDLFYDDKTSNLLYRLLSDTENKIYPYSDKTQDYTRIWKDNFNVKSEINASNLKNIFPADTADITVKNAWAARILHKSRSTFIRTTIDTGTGKQQKVVLKISKVKIKKNYKLEPPDEVDRARFRMARTAELQMKLLQNKLRLINLLAYDKLGEDYQRPYEERIRICLDVIANDPQVKAMGEREQFYEDWRIKFKTQLKRVSDLIAVHLDPEYKMYGPCVMDERLEQAYALLTSIEDSLIDKEETVLHRSVK